MSDPSQHDHHHHHHHGHSLYDVDPTDAHAPQPDVEDTALTRHQIMQIAVTELLIEKKVFSANDMRRQIERMDSITPARGAELVAHAWTDAGFKQRLVADSHSAAAEIGMDLGPIPILVMENTPTVHNVIVCTLCSCYPRMLLGLPPDWYKSREYRSRTVREPRAVLAEFGTQLSAETEIRVHDSTADMRYMVLPMRPEGTEALDKDSLAKLVSRDCMIGVSVPQVE